MRARCEVGIFTMNVFIEALNYDHKNHRKNGPSKFIFTTNITDKFKSNNLCLCELQTALQPRRVRIELNKILLPVCYNHHWWLIVANLKTNRFDVLNSMHMNPTSSNMTNLICNNFRKAMNLVVKVSTPLDESSFPVVIQEVPKQNNLHDCGVYVMKFMEQWDGRRAPEICNVDIYKNRQKIMYYIICHEANKETTSELQKYQKMKMQDKGAQR